MIEMPKVKPGRRVVTLRADWETQDKLREWAKDSGFDLGWDYDGWPQRSSSFDFHITLLATSNSVSIPVEARFVDPLTVVPDQMDELGKDRRVPAIRVKDHPTLTAMRAFFEQSYKATPTFAEFKPHISVSYKWNGDPAIESLPMPGFPLVFDLLVSSVIADAPTTAKDAMRGDRRAASMFDTAVMSGTRVTADGYLVADCQVARVGIQDYAGFEIGASDKAKTYRVWRPEDEVFKASSLASFAHRPVTIGHPDDHVTASTWKRDAVGTVGGDVVRDGGHVRVPLILMDKAAIDLVSGGTREISMGYDCQLEMTSGTTPDGQTYDAIQRDIRINHCAIVERGRAGPACRIGDRVTSNNPQKGQQPMKTVIVDGRKMEVAADVAAVIEALQAKAVTSDGILDKLKDTLPAAHDLVTRLKADVADKDKALAVALKAVDDTKKAIPSAADIAKMAKDRSDLIGDARKIDPEIEIGDESADAIRAKVVQSKKGDAAIKDRSPDYVAAMFDALLSDAADPDPIRDGLKFGDGGKKLSPRDAYLAGLGQDWRPQTK